MLSEENIIVCQHGEKRGIWCRTQAGHDKLVAAIEQRLDAQGANLIAQPAERRAPAYEGLPVRVATSDEWAALERDMAAAEARRTALTPEQGERDGHG